MSTGDFEPAPCPACGSAQVIWRGRRFYDGLASRIRYGVQWPFWQFAGMGPPRPRYRYRGFNERSETDLLRTDLELSPEQYLLEQQYAQLRHAYDRVTTLMTPERFWRCGACGKHGQIFDAESLARLDSYRGDLARMEDDLMRGGAVIDDPIDRSGLSSEERAGATES